MNLTKQTALFFFFLSVLTGAFAQTPNFAAIEKRLSQGDKTAFIELVPHLNDRNSYTEKAGGYEVSRTTVRSVVQRILAENTRFFKVELAIDSSLTTETFKSFLSDNGANLKFDARADIWLITPLESRSSDYVFRKVSDAALEKIALRKPLQKAWLQETGIDKLLAARNPAALWEIAAHLLRTRARYGRPDFTSEEHTDLLRLLTGAEIGIKYEQADKSQAVQFDFGNDADLYTKKQLSFLVYYLLHYKDYVWDDKAGSFKNTRETPQPADKMMELYENLKARDASVAVLSFVGFAELPSEAVDKFFKDRKVSYNNEWNAALPHQDFGIRFLQQLTQLTAYCRTHKIAYKGTPEFHKKWAKLSAAKDLKTRYTLENEWIKTMTIQDITPLEFWGIVYENDEQNTFSVGRILDTWYSKHGNEWLKNETWLALYLKKAALFKELGIVGSCNNYLAKFANISPDIEPLLAKIAKGTAEQDIKKQAEIALNMPPKLASPSEVGHCENCLPYTFEDLKKTVDTTLFDPKENAMELLYDVLKYDGTDAFVGGGGMKRTQTVENAIKILEMKFRTTLTFEQKQSKTKTFYPDCMARANEWLQYLEDKKWVKIAPSELESFTSR